MTTPTASLSWEDIVSAPAMKTDFMDHVIGSTVFPHKNINKTTDGQTESQIDHITVAQKWRSLQDVRVRRGSLQD